MSDDNLDWNRLRSGDYRALDPDHQDVFDMVAALKAEIERLQRHVRVREDEVLELRDEIERLRREHEKAWADAQMKAAEIERLRDVIDRAAKAWLSLHPGVAFEGDVGDAMAAAVAEIERLRDELVTWRRACDGYVEALAARDKEVQELRGFARRVLRVWPDGDLDGGDLQDAAVEAGLLIQRQVTEIPCGPGCRCVDYYDDDDFKAGRHVCYERSREALGE